MKPRAHEASQLFCRLCAICLCPARSRRRRPRLCSTLPTQNPIGAQVPLWALAYEMLLLFADRCKCTNACGYKRSAMCHTTHFLAVHIVLFICISSGYFQRRAHARAFDRPVEANSSRGAFIYVAVVFGRRQR